MDTTTQWEEYQDNILRKACGMGDIIVTIFEKQFATVYPLATTIPSHTQNILIPSPETSKDYPIMASA